MPHAKPDPVKHCENCGVLMTRKRINGRLEDYGVFLRRRNCSKSCANTKREIQVDSHRWRARQIKKRDKCEMCAATEKLHVHHVDRNPANNDPTNLQVLCASCHLTLHWREDRELRMQALRSGGLTPRQSPGGSRCSEGQRPDPRKKVLAAASVYPPRS